MFERLQSFAGLRGPSFAFEVPACAPQNLVIRLTVSGSAFERDREGSLMTKAGSKSSHEIQSRLDVSQ